MLRTNRYSCPARGFTLFELLVVVVLIGILATMAVPGTQRVRRNANETAAVSSLRILVSALDSFRINQNPITYPGPGVVSGAVAVTGIGNLDDTAPAYIDPILASGTKQGYSFSYTQGAVRVVVLGGQNFNAYDTYTITALPTTAGQTGVRTFFVDQTGVVRVDAAGNAPTVADPPLE